MRSVLKKVAAAVLAVVLAASLCGCDRGYIMTVDGMDIRNGVYISFLEMAYSLAQQELEEQNAEIGTPADDDDTPADDETKEDSVPITKETIRGKTGSQWIKDETMKAVRRFVATQRKCEELGLTLTDEELGEINSDLTSTWEDENAYVQYLYGYATMGEYYESRGIGQESMREILKVNALQDKLFLHFYGEGGEFEVTDSEINDYLKETYATVKLMNFTYTDASGKALESDADKKAVKDRAQEYADRINNGEKFADVYYDYEIKKAEDAAAAKYDADSADGVSKDEWIKQQVEAAGIEKAKTEDELDRYVKKETSSLGEKVTNYIFSAPIDGKAVVVEGENGVYLIVKDDVTKKTAFKEENHDGLLNAIKGDEFQSMVDLFGQNYEVVADENLVNKKYGPEKLDPK